MKVGFQCSAFDLLHAGHILMLEECKRNCDYLIVGFQIDPTVDKELPHRSQKKKPVQSVLERYLQLRGCKFIDEIIPYETEDDLMVLLQNLPIDIRFLGADYKDQYYTGKELKIPIHFLARKHNYSSTNLKLKLKDG